MNHPESSPDKSIFLAVFAMSARTPKDAVNDIYNRLHEGGDADCVLTGAEDESDLTAWLEIARLAIERGLSEAERRSLDLSDREIERLAAGLNRCLGAEVRHG